jgi:tRNA(fMet)-specific endonuclease VapC
MKPKYMLDTDMCVFIIRNKVPGLRVRFAGLTRGEMVISTITRGELAYGEAKSDRPVAARQKLDRVILDIPVAPLDESVALTYGRLRRELESIGQMIGSNDLWIAAHALTLGLVLITDNEREFRRIDGLTVENWAKL